MSRWGRRGNEEGRLRRLEGLVGQLLNNPSLDNARNGPFQVPEFDSLPGAPRVRRLQHLATPVITGSAAITLTPGYNSANSWPNNNILDTGGSGTGATVFPGGSILDAAGTITVVGTVTPPNIVPDLRVESAGLTVGTQVHIGFRQGSAGTAGAYFQAGAAGTWSGVTHSGAGSTTTNLGVPVDSTPRLFQVRFTSPTRVEFLVDGDLLHSEVATMPAGTAALRPLIAITTANNVNMTIGTWIGLSFNRRG